jgi:hypothetical protein
MMIQGLEAIIAFLVMIRNVMRDDVAPSSHPSRPPQCG